MKRFLTAGLVLVLLLALLAACKKNNAPSDASASSETTQPAQDQETTTEKEPETTTQSADDQEDETAPAQEEEAALRTLIAWDTFSLCGPLKDVLSGGFERLSLSGQKSSEDATGSSVTFTLEKPRDGGYLKLSGSVYLGKDASNLFDSDEEEPVSDSNTTLFEMAEERIQETGGAVQQTESNGISWNYGFMDASINNAAALRLLVWSEFEGGILYADITAADPSGQPVDSLKQPIEEWLMRLELGGTPDPAKQELCIPFGDSFITAEDFDALKPYGAELSWSAGEGYLNASYSGVREEYMFYCTLQNKAAAGEETADAVRAEVTEALESPLAWKTNITEDVLTAAAELDGDVLIFEMVLSPEGDEIPNEAFSLALDWLKTVTIQ